MCEVAWDVAVAHDMPEPECFVDLLACGCAVEHVEGRGKIGREMEEIAELPSKRSPQNLAGDGELVLRKVKDGHLVVRGKAATEQLRLDRLARLIRAFDDDEFPHRYLPYHSVPDGSGSERPASFARCLASESPRGQS